MNKTYLYKGFGLYFRSEFEIPQLLTVDQADIDELTLVEIKFADLSGFKDADKEKQKKWFWAVDDNRLFIDIEDLASFLVCGGNQILVDPGSDIDSVRLFLLGSAVGALLQQRDYLVLHGAAVLTGGEATVFVAPMGTGKSTLLAGLINKGFNFLCDDVCAIKISKDNIQAFPASHFIKLSQASADKLNLQTEGCKKICSEHNKFYVPHHLHWVDQPVPLNRIIVLSADDRDDFELSHIVGVEKIIYLKYNTYRYYYFDELDRQAAHFKMYKQILNEVPIQLLKRPKEGFRIDELADFVVEHVLQNNV